MVLSRTQFSHLLPATPPSQRQQRHSTGRNPRDWLSADATEGCVSECLPSVAVGWGVAGVTRSGGRPRAPRALELAASEMGSKSDFVLQAGGRARAMAGHGWGTEGLTRVRVGCWRRRRQGAAAVAASPLLYPGPRRRGAGPDWPPLARSPNGAESSAKRCTTVNVPAKGQPPPLPLCSVVCAR